jgi:hypothetical protein
VKGRRWDRALIRCRGGGEAAQAPQLLGNAGAQGDVIPGAQHDRLGRWRRLVSLAAGGGRKGSRPVTGRKPSGPVR